MTAAARAVKRVRPPKPVPPATARARLGKPKEHLSGTWLPSAPALLAAARVQLSKIRAQSAAARAE